MCVDVTSNPTESNVCLELSIDKQVYYYPCISYFMGLFIPYTDSQILELPQGCVLDAIQQAQMLDDLDIEGIFPLYQKITSALEKEDISR